MKSAYLAAPEGLDAVFEDEAKTSGRGATSVASLPGILRSYPGFESSLDDDLESFDAPSLGRTVVARSERSIRPLGAGATTLAPRPERANLPPTVSRRRIDLEGAATVYLKAQAKTDGQDYAPTVTAPDDEAGPLFRELHRSSPATANHLAVGLTSMPEPGDTFLGFRIVEELGRGAFGRVFLAHQGDLAGRLVALKVSAELPGESQTLAQLQHTNIVPIFSAHQAPPLHAVCMPYFGRATLADLLEDVEAQPSLPDSGRAFLKTVGSRRSSVRPSESATGSVVATTSVEQAAAPGSTLALRPAVESESETLRTIGRFSYVDAVLWMGSRIADGLAHAHGRGILHRDLKPANILMTDDGQPMILDFNLSEDIKAEVGASAASAGGTLRYMSPEHLERFLGGSVAVDARSDLYALGVMLYELLTGRPPFEVYPGHSVVVLRKMIQDRQVPPPTLRRHNPAITPAVESIVRRCLQPDPAARYASAAQLHEDLERHLANFPLKYAPEPSVRERAAKWVRRHPRLGSSTTVVIVAAVLLLGLASSVAARGQRLACLEAAENAIRFFDEAARVRICLNHRVGDRVQRAQGVALARQALGRYGVLHDPDWARHPSIASLPAEEQARLRDDVAEILLMLTQATTLDATERGEGQARRDLARSAQRLNGLALASFSKGREPQAFWVQQAALVRLTGMEAEGARLAAEAEKRPLLTARDHYLAAAGLATRGDHAKALPLAEEATRLDPAHFWSYFILGVCHDQLDHHAEAMACFTTCTALRPDFAESWLYRGLAQLKRGRLDHARADFDRAAKLRPDWYEPPLNRSLAYRDMGDHLKAQNDMTLALDLGAPETRVYFLRAAERRATGDRRGAEVDEAEGLKRQPTDVPSWICRGMARMAKNPEEALVDFGEALKLNPRSLEALQMSAYVLSDLPGRDEDTIRMLDRGIELFPDHVPLRSGRGVQLAILGRRDAALRDARESLWRDTSPLILYQVAGIYATTSKTHPEDRPEAYRLLASALRAGFGFDMIDDDHELDAIRNQPEFLALVDSARSQAKERLRRPNGR